MNDSTKYLETGTALSGYAEAGPYHCEDCIHLAVGQDRSAARGLCIHPIVSLDPKLTHPTKTTADVNLPKGCCRFVSQEKSSHPLKSVLRGKIS